MGTNKRHALLSALLSWSRESAGAAWCVFILAKVTLSSRTEASKITKKTQTNVPTNHKDQPLFCHPGPEMDICLIYCVCTCVCVCVFCFQAVLYEIGFLVCAIIGVLYIILMPIVGLILACCRCCGNCGGKMYQKQTSSIHCRRRTLYWGLFTTTIIIL